MANLAILKTVLFLRIFTLLALAAFVVIMVLNNFTDDDGSKAKFTDLIAYGYVFAAGVIGVLYTFIQIPFAIYNVVREKTILPEFDFYGDKVMAFFLASAFGFGFGVTYELKRDFKGLFSDKAEKYLNNGYISAGLLLLSFVLMAVLSIFSSNRQIQKQRLFR